MYKQHFLKPWFFFSILVVIFFACKNGEKEIRQPIQKIKLEKENSCSYSGVENKDAFLFQSDSEAEEALALIMKHIGLPANFVISAADIDNAGALIHDNKRYILYSQKFFEDIKEQTGTKYGAISVLAHEIGHHLAGHTLSEKEARSTLELEADRFSGFILAKMGANMDEACAAMNIFGSEIENETHPGKNTRLAAIVNGWEEGIEDNTENTVEEIATPDKSIGKYVVNVQNKEKEISLKNKSFFPDDYNLNDTYSRSRRFFNNEKIIMHLPNGTEIDILSSIGNTYYVRANTETSVHYGYIAKSFEGVSTIKRIK
jgi:hypothetical protein